MSSLWTKFMDCQTQMIRLIIINYTYCNFFYFKLEGLRANPINKVIIILHNIKMMAISYYIHIVCNTKFWSLNYTNNMVFTFWILNVFFFNLYIRYRTQFYNTSNFLKSSLCLYTLLYITSIITTDTTSLYVTLYLHAYNYE